MVEQLGYAQSGALLGELIETEQAAAEHATRLRPARNLARGQKSKVRNFRPIAADDAFPEEWRLEWNRLTGRMADLRERLTVAVGDDGKQVEAARTACSRPSPTSGRRWRCPRCTPAAADRVSFS